MIFAAVLLFSLVAGVSGISSRCLHCICLQESGCHSRGCGMDVGSLSCGYYQLKHNYWVDCGRPGGSLEACGRSKSCSETCVRNYMHKYGRYCTHGVTPTCEDFARIHNGGPHGCRNGNTIGYWHSVESHGCSRYS